MRFAKNVSTRIFYMDQGMLYESGTPDQIFNHPEKNRTRVFINNLKSLIFKIDSKDYDFIGINEKLTSFGLKHSLEQDRIDNLLKVFEEICLVNILPNKDNDNPLTAIITYSEDTKEISMSFVYKGIENNPIINGDTISLKLIESTIKSSSYKYIDEENRLIVTL